MSLNTVSEWGSEDDAPPLSPTASPSTTFTAHQSRNVPQFDGLPPEVRVEIYRHLFEGAELVVSPITMQRSNKHDRNSPYRLIGGIDTSIIRTSRFIYAEALPYLADTTKLVIRRQESRNDPLENLHRDFLASIRSITVHIDTFVHIGRCRLPSLLRVQVVHEEVHLPSLPDVVEFLTGPDSAECMDELMEMMMEEVLSWKWKLHQFSLLGDWEGFDVTMTGVWRCFPETEAGVVRVPASCESAPTEKLTGIQNQLRRWHDRQFSSLHWRS